MIVMQIQVIIVLSLIALLILYLYYIEPKIIRQRVGNKNEHGSARWATVKEIKNNFKEDNISHLEESGFPILFSKDYKKVWFDMKTPHWIYLGSTGSGKTVTAVCPVASFIASAKIKKSVFITDPKGEIFKLTSKMFKDNGYKLYTLDFRNPSLSNRLNLLEPIIIQYELYIEFEKKSSETDDEKLKVEYTNESVVHLSACTELAGALSSMLMNDITAREKYWNNSAADLFYGLVFMFLEDYADGKIKREQITVSSIKKFQVSSMSENSKKLKEYVNKKSYKCNSKPKILSMLNMADNTYRSITSTFSERLSLYDYITVENLTASSDFDFDILGKEKSVVYVSIPDESKIYYSLVSIVVSLMYRSLVLLCGNNDDARLPVDVVFLLDEFANCPPINDIETIVSVARSRGMWFNFFLQSFAQLDNLYGKEISQIIQDNTGLAYLKTLTDTTAEAISKRLGSATIETNSVNYQMSLMQNNGSKNTSLMGRPLMTPDEIKQLHYKTIIFPTEGHPIFRKTVMYNKFSCYKSGCVDRPVRPLSNMSNTYYTIDDIEVKDSETKGKPRQISIEEKTILDKLSKVTEKVRSIFGNIDFDVDFKKVNGINVAVLFLGPPVPTGDIVKINTLSETEKFYFAIKTGIDKTDKKDRNSMIEISFEEIDKEV